METLETHKLSTTLYKYRHTDTQMLMYMDLKVNLHIYQS